MKNELLLRIITSIIILPISLFLIFKGEIFFIIFLSIIGIILIKEWTSVNNKKSLPINLIGFFYISISLTSIYFLRGDNIYQFHIFIWILFILFTKNLLRTTVIIYICMVLLFITEDYINYYTNMKNKERVEKLTKISTALKYIILFLIIIGHILYVLKQKNNFGNDFNIIKLYRGTKCILI